MNKTRFLTIAVVALTLLNIVALAALWKHNNPPPLQEGPRKIIIKRLHFDPGQVAAYDLLVEKHRADIRRKDREMAETRQAIYRQLQQDDFSKKDSLFSGIAHLQVSIEQTHLAHFQDIKKLCRPEQVADFNTLANELAEFFPGKKGR